MGREGAKDTVPEAGGHPIRVGLVLEVMIQMEPLHTSCIMTVKSSSLQHLKMQSGQHSMLSQCHYIIYMSFRV
jgi:hypothetical protein